jgi:hypothetical protein
MLPDVMAVNRGVSTMRHDRRAALQKFIIALREADREAYAAGEWERLEIIRLTLSDALSELKSLPVA